MSLWDLFRVQPGQRPAAASGETESVRKITNVLDQMEPDRARYIAAFAYILSRVARSDQEVSPEETRLMEGIVAEQGEFGEEQAIIVVQMAKTQNQLFGSTENYLVTREFERMATREQRLALLDCLFAVAAAEQEDEPLQVLAQLADAVGGMAYEVFQAGAKPGGIAGQPLAEELQQLGEFGGVDDVQFHLRHGGHCPSGVSRVKVRLSVALAL